MLDLNITLLIQLGNFLITIIVLNILLIRPLRKVMRERRELMDGLDSDAAGFEARAKSSLDTYEAQLAEARHQAAANREEGRGEGLREQQAVLDTAQQEAHGILAEARAKLDAEAQSSLAELRGKVDAYSRQLAARVLGA